MITFLHGIVVVAAAGCGAALTVRWILPSLLKAVQEILVQGVFAAAAVLLFPEYLWSTAMRARGRTPARLAHNYGDIVAGGAWVITLALRRLCRGLAESARRVPPVVVGLVAGLIQLLLLIS